MRFARIGVRASARARGRQQQNCKLSLLSLCCEPAVSRQLDAEVQKSSHAARPLLTEPEPIPEVDSPISIKATLLIFCFSCPLATQALDFQFRPFDVLSSTLIKHRTAVLC